MKNLPIYLLGAGLLIVIAVFAVIASQSMSGVPVPASGRAIYIWIGGGIMLAVVVGFFLWLIGKGK